VVVVVAILTAREGMEQAAEELVMREVIPPTHGEDGCAAFALHRDTADPRRLVLIERWADRAALDAHLATEHLRAFRAKAPEVFDGPAQVLVLDPRPAGDPAKGVLG
jgi:quinol monooxygenase YgiN